MRAFTQIHQFIAMQTPTHKQACARAHTHIHEAEAVDRICPSSSGSVVATPAASPPPVMFDSRGRIHHLLGSLGASQLPPRGFAGNGSWEALGWSLPSFGSSCVGDKQRCGTDVSLEPTEGMADFNISHVCYSTFSWEEGAGPWSDSQLNT